MMFYITHPDWVSVGLVVPILEDAILGYCKFSLQSTFSTILPYIRPKVEDMRTVVYGYIPFNNEPDPPIGGAG